LSRLDSAFWSGQASRKLPCTGLFVNTYYNNVIHGHIAKALSLLKASGKVLKTDLWNESVATERNILGLFNESFGVDISKTVCLKAHSQSKKTSVVQGDICSLPYRDGCFSLILDLSTIDHISLTDAYGVISEYKRLLTNGGVLLLCYAQDMPFAPHYWSSQFEGVYLLNAAHLNKCVDSHFKTVFDCGIDFLHSIMGIGPYRLVERFLWHCPNSFREDLLNVLLRFEASWLSRFLKSYSGLRLLICVKGEIL